MKKEQIKEMETYKKETAAGITLAGEATKNFETGKPISGLVDQELNALMKRFNDSNPGKGRVDERRFVFENIGPWDSISFYSTCIK